MIQLLMQQAALALALAVTLLLTPGDPIRIGRDECACAEAVTQNAWCLTCEVGYIAAVPIRSYLLFEALDAHGHVIDVTAITCASCRRAIRSDGYCEVCRFGFVDEQLYFTRLTHALARGETVAASCMHVEPARSDDGPRTGGEAGSSPIRPPAGPPTAGPGGSTGPATTKPAARVSAGTKRTGRTISRPVPPVPAEPAEPAWCSLCNAGFVGNVRFTNRPDYDAAAVEYMRLVRSTAEAARCELCAIALHMGTTCPRCPPGLRVVEGMAPPPPGDTTGGERTRE